MKTTWMAAAGALPAGAASSPGHRGRSRRLALAALAAMLLGIFLTPTAIAQNVHRWSPAVSVDPERNGVNTSVNDGCPFEAPDGHVLFIATNRDPANPGGAKDLDIWVAYRDGEGGAWGSPEPLPAPVNTAAQEFCPTPLPGNQLLFVRSPGACGGPDIYYSRLRMFPLGWTEPEPLPCDSVNSPFEEFSPSLVEAEGRTLLFFSSNRDTNTNAHKIYSIELLPDGMWTSAQLIDELNALDVSVSDARPNVRADGLEIVFDSNRDRPAQDTDIFIARRPSLSAPWSPPRRLTTNVNSDGGESRASFSRDGMRLYFGSTRANAVFGGSGADIYVSTRTGKKK